MISIDDIIDTLRSHQATFERIGVRHLSVFGSRARGDANAASDIDIAIDFDPALRGRGLAYFGKRQTVEDTLLRILPHPVDLSDESMMRESMRADYAKDRIVAF